MASRCSKPICVDLFSGAGGLSEGLRQAGFRPVLAVDFDKNALATYELNHPNVRVKNADVCELTADEVIDACEGRELDLLAGGPSCQGYSTHGKRNADDPRNFLFRHFLRLVDETRPKWVLMENVPGLLTYQKGHFKQLIHDGFNDIGYTVKTAILCAADFGVPQLRRRIFFIGAREDTPVSFPSPTHAAGADLFSPSLTPYVTVNEAIGDLPLLGENLRNEDWEYSCPPQSDFQRYARRYSQRPTLHQANGVSKQALSVIRHVKEGYGLRSVPVAKLPDRFKKMRKISNGQLRRDCTTLYYRLARNRPAYTITCFFRNVASGPFTHPLENRSLSYREAARLMSFQDHYEFVGTSIARQIGNAVPPLIARAIGRHLLELAEISWSNASSVSEQQAL